MYREYCFGDIVRSKFIASEMGLFAEKYWVEIPNKFPFVELGNSVTMPNHVHGVLIIDKMNVIDDIGNVGNVETRLIESLPSSTKKQPTETKSTDNKTPKKQGGITGN